MIMAEPATTEPNGGQATPPAAPVTPPAAEPVKSAAEIQQAFISELGFKSSDELKAVIESQKAAEDANKTEVQKAQEELAKEQASKGELNDQLINTKAQLAALQLGVSNDHLADAVALAKIENADDISKGLEAVIARNPQFTGQPANNPDGSAVVNTNLGGSNPSITKDEFDSMTYQQRLNVFNTNPTLYNQLK
ncbi:putative scaffolding protein [Latilactobacillus phage TMW 1.2272 P1]|nr:putative scaffolding protein [Latilactobacillus phage TMW 1.2272 P1]